MEKSLLDTDMLSELLHGKNLVVWQRGVEYRKQFGYLSTTAVKVFEIINGFKRAGLEARIVDFEDRLATEEVFSFDEQAAAIAGHIFGELVRRGRTIGHIDPLIAAIALQHDLTPVTGNAEHFGGLSISDTRFAWTTGERYEENSYSIGSSGSVAPSRQWS